MEEKEKQIGLDQLSEIHSMMERSSRFISLSGLSGVIAGIIGISGAIAAHYIIRAGASLHNPSMIRLDMHTLSEEVVHRLMLLGIAMLVVAVSFGIILTAKKAKRKHQSIWGKTSQLLVMNLIIPLIAGGIFSLALLYHDLFGLIAPVTLIFYGLALINASKYTLTDIRYLGYFEIVLGLISCFFVSYGLLFWALGFGLLHILYGGLMYFKYDRV